MSDKEIAKKSKTDIANLSDDLILASAGKGLQNISNDDVTIPRLAIVQSGSPQRKKKDEKYIDGADEGMIFNTVTNELYKDSLEVIPCGYRKTYVEWVPRDKGGGLVAVQGYSPAVLTMTSSNLGVSRKWNTLLKMKRINVKGQTVEAPSFLFKFKLSTVEAENDLGNWHKYKIEEAGQIETRDIFKEAEKLADSVTTGKVKASEPTETSGEDAPF
jgi:hypothetical protein